MQHAASTLTARDDVDEQDSEALARVVGDLAKAASRATAASDRIQNRARRAANPPCGTAGQRAGKLRANVHAQGPTCRAGRDDDGLPTHTAVRGPRARV